MADCWREVAAQPGVELKIWVEQLRNGDTAFKPDELMRGLDFQKLYSDKIGAAECQEAENAIAAFCPDALFICGWARNWPKYLANSSWIYTAGRIAANLFASGSICIDQQVGSVAAGYLHKELLGLA